MIIALMYFLCSTHRIHPIFSPTVNPIHVPFAIVVRERLKMLITDSYDHSLVYSVYWYTRIMIQVGQAKWDDIKILGYVVCPSVGMSVCVYVGH